MTSAPAMTEDCEGTLSAPRRHAGHDTVQDGDVIEQMGEPLADVIADENGHDRKHQVGGKIPDQDTASLVVVTTSLARRAPSWTK